MHTSFGGGGDKTENLCCCFCWSDELKMKMAVFSVLCVNQTPKGVSGSSVGYNKLAHLVGPERSFSDYSVMLSRRTRVQFPAPRLGSS